MVASEPEEGVIDHGCHTHETGAERPEPSLDYFERPFKAPSRGDHESDIMALNCICKESDAGEGKHFILCARPTMKHSVKVAVDEGLMVCSHGGEWVVKTVALLNFMFASFCVH